MSVLKLKKGMKMIDLSQQNILMKYKKALKEISFDKANKKYMTQSAFPAVDFDEVKDNYIFSNSSISAREMRSNDALVIFNAKQGQFIFIEFKDGNITSCNAKEKIRVKIAESLLILNDILDENLTFDRSNINYILVYNKSKNSEFERQRNSSLTGMARALAKSAGMTYLIDGFDRYNAFFHNVKTINENEFDDISKELENSKYIF